MKRGWCPGLYQPMPSADGLLVRLRPPGGWLDAARLQALAKASRAFGNGRLELTAQGRLQVRGLAEDSWREFAAAMVAAGLASADPGVEARRRVTVLPDGDAVLGQRLEQAVIRGSFALADKFDIVLGVDDAPAADIMLDGNLLWLAGATRGAHTADPIAAVVRLARGLAGGRIRTLVEALGQDAVYRAAGLSADRAIPACRPPLGGCEVGLVFGRLDPLVLRDLARHGDGFWRVTRSRALRLGDVRAPAALADEARAAGLIVDADDPRRRIAACVGRGGCSGGSVDAREDALALLDDLPAGASLHVSGCAKGCAQPGPSDFKLVGDQGAYDLYDKGNLEARGLSLGAIRTRFEEGQGPAPGPRQGQCPWTADSWSFDVQTSGLAGVEGVEPLAFLP